MNARFVLLPCILLAWVRAFAQTPAPTPTPIPAVSEADRADMDVAGTLARVPGGGTMRVTVWAKNRGSTTWTPKDVRIIVRWVDFDAGTRRRWSSHWLKKPVAPLGQFRLPLDLPVPAKAGRYKVIYGLVRARDGQLPPVYTERQDRWPGQFAAVAFAVNVQDAGRTPA